MNKKESKYFNTAMKNATLLQLDENYNKMFRYVFTPILERYRVPSNNRHYIMAFYIQGLMAIIEEWMKADCQDSIEHIIGVIQDCVAKK